MIITVLAADFCGYRANLTPPNSKTSYPVLEYEFEGASYFSVSVPSR